MDPAAAVLDSQTRELLGGPNFAHVATLMPDGAPQVAPVWVDLEGDKVVFVREKRSLAYRNLRRDRRVAISVNAVGEPYRCGYIRGRVVEFRDEPAAGERLNGLALKYLGFPYPPPRPAPCAMVIVEPTTARSDDFSSIRRTQSRNR